MAPAYAVPRMLERNGLTLQDFDYYEIHEEFAAQVLCTLKAWEDPVFCKERLGLDAPLGSIDRAKLNVNGSSLAAGHPFAATGGRIIPVLARLLAEKGSGRLWEFEGDDEVFAVCRIVQVLADAVHHMKGTAGEDPDAELPFHEPGQLFQVVRQVRSGEPLDLAGHRL